MVSITLKLLQGILKGSKREEWAVHLTPEKLGELAATKVRLWLDKTSTPDGTIGAVTEEEIKQLANDSPAAIQSLLVASLDGPQSASDETNQILESYVAVLNPIAEALRSLETSIALRGFLHDAECVSYWHLASKHGKDEAFRKLGSHLAIGGGLEIYILNVVPTDDVLDTLNATIRGERSRLLPSDFFDYRRDESVAKVEDIHELSVTLRQLDPERDAKQAKAKSDPFKSLYDHMAPIKMEWNIPSGVPGLLTLVESLPAATRAQAKFSIDLAGTLERAKRRTQPDGSVQPK